jgi:ankyrin repeat protein
MLSAAYGSTKIARLLIASGANVNASNVYGETALMIAKERGCTEIVQLLREHVAVE